MQRSKSEAVLNALHALLTGIPGAVLDCRNAALPEIVPSDGLLILRDGTVEDDAPQLGGFDSVYVRHSAKIDVIVSSGDDAERDRKFDGVLLEIGARIRGNNTLGGLVYGMIPRRPEPLTEAIPGAAAIKAGVVTVQIEYEATSALE